jgi:hypothetical protein
VELACTCPEGGGDLVSGRGAADPELGIEVVDRLPNRHGTILRRENGVMTSWRGVETAAPTLAGALAGRFADHKHALLATLRRDGSPRISGIETSFRSGELWLAMMPDSRKAADLRRDPRFALHAAPVDLDLVDGAALLNGRAIEVTDPSELARFVVGLEQAPPPSGVGLFRAELTDASLTRVEGDWLVIDSWREGEGPRHRRRQ